MRVDDLDPIPVGRDRMKNVVNPAWTDRRHLESFLTKALVGGVDVIEHQVEGGVEGAYVLGLVHHDVRAAAQLQDCEAIIDYDLPDADCDQSSRRGSNAADA